jgi:hypothetical protein
VSFTSDIPWKPQLFGDEYLVIESDLYHPTVEHPPNPLPYWRSPTWLKYQKFLFTMENPSNICSPSNLPKYVVKSEYPSGKTRKADKIEMELPELKKIKIEDCGWGATKKFLAPWYDTPNRI